MTHAEQVAAWHANKPDWAENFTARDWSTLELVAERFDIEMAPEPEDCTKAPAGYYCTRQAGHDGPCAAHPTLGF